MARVSRFLVYAIVLALSNSSLAARPASPRPTAVHYDLHVEVFADARRLAVTGSMRIPAASAPRPYVEFLLSSMMQDLQVEIAGAKANEDRGILEKVKTEGGWLTPQSGKPTENVVYRVRA